MLKAILKDLEVINEVYFLIGIPFDLVKRHFVWIGGIQKMAIYVSRA